MDQIEKTEFERIIKNCELNIFTTELAIEMQEILKEMYIYIDTREKIQESLDINIPDYVKKLLETIQKDMYNRALERRESLTFEAHNLDDMKEILENHPGFIHAMWCGDSECETKIKEIKGCKSRCIIEEKAIDDKCVCCGKKAKHHVIWGIQY